MRLCASRVSQFMNTCGSETRPNLDADRRAGKAGDPTNAKAAFNRGDYA